MTEHMLAHWVRDADVTWPAIAGIEVIQFLHSEQLGIPRGAANRIAYREIDLDATSDRRHDTTQGTLDERADRITLR